MIIHWYVESNTLAGGVQGAIVQQQAAFERFAWTLKENNLAFESMSDKNFDELRTVEKISELLRWAEIQELVPPYNKNIIKYFKAKRKILSGPDLIVDIRNSLVHPKPVRRQMLNDISQDMLLEVYRLGQNYLKQLVNKVLDMPAVIIEFPTYSLEELDGNY